MGCVGCIDGKKNKGGPDEKAEKEQTKSPQYRVHQSEAKEKDQYRHEHKKQGPEVINVEPYDHNKNKKDEQSQERKKNMNEDRVVEEDGYQKNGNKKYEQAEDFKPHYPATQEYEQDRDRVPQIPHTSSDQIKVNNRQQNKEGREQRQERAQGDTYNYLRPNDRSDGNTLKPINQANQVGSRSAKVSEMSERGSEFKGSYQNGSENGSYKNEPSQPYQRASKINASNLNTFEMDEPPKRASKMQANTRDNRDEKKSMMVESTNTYGGNYETYKNGTKSAYVSYNEGGYVGNTLVYKNENQNEVNVSTHNNYNEVQASGYREGQQNKFREGQASNYRQGEASNYRQGQASSQKGQENNYNRREDFTESKGNTITFSKANQVYQENNPNYIDKYSDGKKSSHQGSRRGQENNGYRQEKEQEYKQNYERSGAYMNGSSKYKQSNHGSQKYSQKQGETDPYGKQYRVHEPKPAPQYEGDHTVFDKSSKLNESASNRYNEGQYQNERASKMNASRGSNRQNQGNNEEYDKNSRVNGSKYNVSRHGEQNFQKSGKLDLSKSNQYFNDKVNQSFDRGNRGEESRAYNYHETTLGASGLNYSKSKSKVEDQEVPHSKYNFQKNKLDNSRAFAKSNDGSRGPYQNDVTRTQGGGLRLVSEAPLQASRQNASRISSQVEEMVYNTATYNYNKPAHVRSNVGGEQPERRHIFNSQVQNYSRPPLDSRTGKSYHDPNNRVRESQAERNEGPTNSAYRSKVSNHGGQSAVNQRSEVRPYKMEPVPEEDAGDTMGFGWGSKILKL